jgi:predicted RNA-binding Zn-ribbon protein involved in translation (DUF1610 family)
MTQTRTEGANRAQRAKMGEIEAHSTFQRTMRTIHTGKHWQNLAKKRCIVCGDMLTKQKDYAVMYECPRPGCGFTITQRKFYEILTDDTHILRQFLTEDERKGIEKAVDSLIMDVTDA